MSIIEHDRFAIVGTIGVADNYPDTLSNKGRCNSSYRQMAGNSLFSKFLVGATIVGTSLGLLNEVKAETPKQVQQLEELVMQTPTIPDTVYSDMVTSNVKLNNQPFEGAQISYTLLDTVNNTQLLIREAITNANGQDIIDSLPVLKHYDGIDLHPLAYNDLIITNNGIGSDHLIRFKTDAKSVNKEASIYNIAGQQIAIVPVIYNGITETYDIVWHGQDQNKGIYLFATTTSNGIVSEKILHEKNKPSDIDFNAGTTNNSEQEDGLKSTRNITDDLAVSKYAIAITNNNLETLLDTVLVKENSFHNFVFNVNSVQYDDANVSGELFFTVGGQPTNANVEYKRLLNQSQKFNTTAPNGNYQIDVPVVYEQQNPGQTKYIVTLTENGDPFLTEVDTVLVSPGANSFEQYVIQTTQQSDTVYSKIVTSHVFLDGIAVDGANISYTLLDSITGNQELIREALTNTNGEDIVDSLPVLRAETGLGASKYIINITRDNLEDLIDTVLVKENTFHDFYFNTTGTQYADGDVWGQIDFTDSGGQSPTNANVEYKRLLNQSDLFSTTAPNGVYNIQVPVVFEQQNPGQTKYIVTISENEDPFITKIDTVLVSPGTNGFLHYVTQILPPDAEQDFQGIVRHAYTKQPESGVTVRVINRTTNELIDEVITGSDGAYSFENIPQGTLVEFELGKSGELWMVNNEYDIPSPITDTLEVLNRYFYPSTVEVPEVGANSTFQGDGEEAAEMVGSDFINFEEILRDTDLMWASGPWSEYWSARTYIQDNFYEGTSPITTANTQRNITNTMQSYYEPYTNFYAGQLGWNVDFGQGNHTAPVFAVTNYDVAAILGGEIMATGGGSEPLAPVIKELQGRRLKLGTVNSRTSMMNANPAMPDNKDRAYVYMILINQKGRFSLDEETYNLTDLTSNAPTMRANEGQGVYGKEAPLLAADYVDMKGQKPHSKSHFNQEKFNEQMQAQREEQIKSYLLQQLSK